MTRTVLSILMALLLVVADLASQGGTITGLVVDVRERENGDHSLLVQAESTARIARIILNLPQRFAFTPGFVPSEWKVLAQGRRIEASGDPVYRLNLRLNANPNQKVLASLPGKEAEVEVFIPGTSTTFKYKPKVGTLPRVAPAAPGAPAGVVFPPEITSGAQFLFSYEPNFRGGVFVSGVDTPSDRARMAHEATKIAETARRTPPLPEAKDHLKSMRINAIAGNQEPAVTTYVDPWDETLIGVEHALLPEPATSCSHAVTGGTPLAFAGKDACIRGCFGGMISDFEKLSTILFDDTRPVTVKAASPTTIVVRLADDETPGLKVWRFPGWEGQLTIRVLKVEGIIAQEELWKGQSTTMYLKILGTDEPVRINIVNTTPETIRVEGGERQAISSSGGPANLVTRQVTGIRKGDFSINYSVDQPPCGGGQ